MGSEREKRILDLINRPKSNYVVRYDDFVISHRERNPKPSVYLPFLISLNFKLKFNFSKGSGG